LTAAIGVAAGTGREATAVLATFIALLIFVAVPWVVRSIVGVKEKVLVNKPVLIALAAATERALVAEDSP